jgi:hypothetical protein
MRAAIVIAASLWASAASAFDLNQLALGSPQAEVLQQLNSAGVKVGAAQGGGSSSFASSIFVDVPQPAQLKFCDGRLVGVSQLLPGNIRAFLDRAAQESRRRGLTIPRMSTIAGSEIVYAQWRIEDGNTLSLVWSATADGGTGSMVLEGTCQTPSEQPSPVAALPQASTDRPAPSPDMDHASAGYAGGELTPPGSAENVLVPLPDQPTNLAVNKFAPEPDPEQNPEVTAETFIPKVQPPPRPKTVAPRPAAKKTVRVLNGDSGLNSTATVTPPTIRRVPAQSHDPEQTNSTGAAEVRVTTPDVPDEATGDEPMTLSAQGSESPTLGALPRTPEKRRWKPATVEACAKAFKSYSRQTQTYKNPAGLVESCP